MQEEKKQDTQFADGNSHKRRGSILSGPPGSLYRTIVPTTAQTHLVHVYLTLRKQGKILTRPPQNQQVGIIRLKTFPCCFGIRSARWGGGEAYIPEVVARLTLSPQLQEHLLITWLSWESDRAPDEWLMDDDDDDGCEAFRGLWDLLLFFGGLL
jgi:hypothetical protein